MSVQILLIHPVSFDNVHSKLLPGSAVPQAVKLLRDRHTVTGGQRWLFPNYRRPKTCMRATTLNRALERMGFNGKGSIGISAHGLPTTASTVLNELGYRPVAPLAPDLIARIMREG